MELIMSHYTIECNSKENNDKSRPDQRQNPNQKSDDRSNQGGFDKDPTKNPARENDTNRNR